MSSPRWAQPAAWEYDNEQFGRVTKCGSPIFLRDGAVRRLKWGVR